MSIKENINSESGEYANKTFLLMKTDIKIGGF